MKEHPILFSGPMVRAILEGRKTQTRRVVKPQPKRLFGLFTSDDGRLFIETERLFRNRKANELGRIYSPYGKPGDRLWVRETWWKVPTPSLKDFREGADTWPKVAYVADDDNPQYLEWGWKRKPSIHMPRAGSRINLEMVTVRIERLNNISDADAVAEGMINKPLCHVDVRFQYEQLWNKINEKRGFGWDTNPWVWVIEFRKVV